MRKLPDPRASLRTATWVVAGLVGIQGAACVSLEGLTGGSLSRDDAPSGVSAGGEADAGDPSTQQAVAATDADAESGTQDATATSAPPAEDAGVSSTAPPDTGGTDAAPARVLFAAPTAASPTIGGDSGTAFVESCAAGAAMVGLNLIVDTDDPFALVGVQALCADVTLPRAGGVALSSAKALDAEGDGGAGLAGTLLCPGGSVLVGMSASAQAFVHAVVLECDELQVDVTDQGASFTLGNGTLVGPFGGSGGNPIPAYQCPPPAVVTSLSGSAGGSGFIDSLVLGCATPQSR